MSLTKTLFSVIVLFLFSSLPTSAQLLDNFLECLVKEPAITPILEAVYTPENSSFQSVLNAYIKNRRFLTPETTKPIAIITAKDDSQIQATLFCAKSNGVQVRIRSGGHDLEGLSYTSNVPFVILDMFNFRSIDIDIANETAWVESGAILGELYYNIAQKSQIHAFPAGVCLSLGVGGHFSGGGYGTMMRKYGLSVDNIIGARIVDSNGNIYMDRRSMGEDVFWAIRGGGGASFGVILAYQIKLVRVPAKVTVFSVPKTLEQGATDVVYKWQQVLPTIERELFVRVQSEVQNSTNGKKTVRATFIGLYLGQPSKLLNLMKRKFPELGLKQEDCKEVSWLQSTLFWDNQPIDSPLEIMLNRSIPANIFYKSKSDYVKTIISKSDLNNVWNAFMKTEGMVMQWNPYGGRMSEIPETRTPFPHRAGNLFKIQYFTLWFEETKEANDRHINLARQMYESMAPYVSKDPREAFLNYRDLDIGSNPSNVTNYEKARVYGSKYFKNNFIRLTQVKKKFDPENFFKNEQSIPLPV